MGDSYVVHGGCGLDESKARGRAEAKVRTTAKAKADPPSGDDKQERQKKMIERFDGVCQG